jgi:branched-chain amino acid transport system ATP-binding protein
VSYGGIVAVDGLSLEVQEGELVGLIGANGAGKTTAIDALTGFVPHAGMVSVDGVDVSGLAPHLRTRAGLSRTWQSVELFEDLTVRQQCLVSAHPPGFADLMRDAFRPGRKRAEDSVDAALDLLGLTGMADAKPSELAHGTQKLVGVARALCSDPAVLLLDEPAAGLDTAESEEFGRHLREIAGTGTAVLLVDHDTQLVMETCHRVAVLDFGSLIALGEPASVRANPAVVEAYLGVGGGLGGPAPGEGCQGETRPNGGTDRGSPRGTESGHK